MIFLVEMEAGVDIMDLAEETVTRPLYYKF